MVYKFKISLIFYKIKMSVNKRLLMKNGKWHDLKYLKNLRKLLHKQLIKQLLKVVRSQIDLNIKVRR